MALELTLSFSSIDHVTVTLTNRSPISIPFTSPFTNKDWEEIQRYLEKYPVQYAAKDVDDIWAAGMVEKLRLKGEELFRAVFGGDAQRIFNAFQDAEGEGRQITIAASQPEILRLPWELLCDPTGTYLLHETPQIAVRRQLTNVVRGSKAVKPKAQLRLLMVVSRPDGEGFLDPRAEAKAVLKAIEQRAPGRVVVEFLRPATLKNLRERLQDRSLPVDIVHFDGHGAFTIDGEVTVGKHDGLTKGSKSLDMGYLLFEDAEGGAERVSAEKLGDALNRQQVSLVVLSACQSAMMGRGEDALGCVAAQLTNRGIPAVLAMTYSVLVTTTEQLFGKFYGELAAGQSLGIALANARQDLYFEQKRGLRWRGTEQIELELSDWFLPAWYQAGGDIKLLKQARTLPPVASPKHRLPELAEEGFFGRSRELWEIDQEFVRGTRRITIAGFGGQGKTYLAIEAGRWLAQTGMFDAVCFVDYAAFQGVDAVGMAVAEIGVVLEQSLIDAAAVTKALGDYWTLVILDNLESLDAAALQELLTVAKEWSQVGATRLLLTTRGEGLSHADYPAVNSRQHRLLPLSGLGNKDYPEDAIRYFQGLMKLPPAPQWDLPPRAALIELFELVQFHPLSIKLVAYQLKERRVGDLARSLETLLAAELQDEKDRCLIASLNLSLQRLDKNLLAVLPRLGVFQGRAFEKLILDVTQFTPEQWQELKAALLRTGLVQVEEIEIPFLRFHPTLAPVLWGRLTAEEQGELRLRHQQEYYALMTSLYVEDSKNPEAVRACARRELPNLLWAVNGALDDHSENAIDFVDSVNRFLDCFGLKRDQIFLSKRLSQIMSEVGSNEWYLALSNQGHRLFSDANYTDASAAFVKILEGLESKSSFNRINTLMSLGQCLHYQGQLFTAVEFLQDGLRLSEQLEPGNDVKQQRWRLQKELGDILRCLGEFNQAQQAYENSLAITKEIEDRRGSAVVNGQMGTLSILKDDLPTAIRQFSETLQIFQQLQEPEQESISWYQLGIVYEKNRNWAAADRAYREAARIDEQQGNMTGAASTYRQLASLNKQMQKLFEAEQWYRKALQINREVVDKLGESTTLHNLAHLLANQPKRLSEAHQMEIDALAIKLTLDPAAAKIWKTYDLLARIATAQNEPDKAKEYRHLARTTKAAFAGTQHELQQHAPFIELVVAAVGDASAREQLEQELVRGGENGRGQLVAAIRRVLAGERDLEVLWDDLDADDSMIIVAILRKIGEA
jgi:tetratricopeptide (TPR) repeat protein